mgnify:CR=1 FL=1
MEIKNIGRYLQLLAGLDLRANRLLRKPRVLQFPLTSICQARCVMCDVWKFDRSKDLGWTEFSEILRNDFFSEVNSVGVNGGEPAALRDLDQYLASLLVLPKIKTISIISNGFISRRFLAYLKKFKQSIHGRDIRINLTISLDGIDSVHDRVRGIPGVFSKVVKTIELVQRSPGKYCDSLDVACTLMEENIESFWDLYFFCDERKLNFSFRKAVQIDRLENVMYRGFIDQGRVSGASFCRLAFEFFKRSSSLHDKYRYWCFFSDFFGKRNYRKLGCAWRDGYGVTLNAQGTLGICSVDWKDLGSGLSSVDDLIARGSNALTDLRRNSCDHCQHDYRGLLPASAIWQFTVELLLGKSFAFIYWLLVRLRR